MLVVATSRAGAATDATSAPSCVRFFLCAHISLRACVCCVCVLLPLCCLCCVRRCMHKARVNFWCCPTCVSAQEAVRRWRNARDGFFRTRNGSRTCPCSDGVSTRGDHAWRPVTDGGLAGVMDVTLCPPSVLAAKTADICPSIDVHGHSRAAAYDVSLPVLCAGFVAVFVIAGDRRIDCCVCTDNFF